MKEIRICGNSNNETAKSLRNFLNSTLQRIMSVIGAEQGSLFLFDSAHKELILDSFYHSGELDLTDVRQKLGEGISGKVIETGEPTLVKDIARDSRFMSNGFKHYRTNSFISVPISCPCGLVALINIADKSNGEPFLAKDLEFTAALCDYASLVVENITRSAKLKEEKELLWHQKVFLEKYASMGKLAAGIVHEINNPLDGVLRYTNIVLSQIKDHSVIREYILEAKKGLSRIANITKSLLEFSQKINSEREELKRYTDIHGVIDETVSALREEFNGSIKLTKNYKDNLPQVLNLGLEHVVTNIVKNALDAMPLGGTLGISTDINDSGICINFKDSGSGIPEEIRNRIFEPFFTTKSIGKGTGLGLAMCKEIISKYDGDIQVESSPNQGSSFTILIPKKYLKNA